MPPVNRPYRACCCILLGAVAAVLPVWGQPPATTGVTFHSETFRDLPFTVAWIDLNQATLELFWKDPDDQPFVNFSRLESWLVSQGKTIVIATNSGIFAEDRTPLGLHISGGKTLRPLNDHPGSKSNFALKPNGVFYIDGAGAHVITTEAYAATPPTPELAVQSGPMLVVDDQLHPKFNEESTSIHFRNGIGVASPDRIAIVISNLPVNLHTFASIFQEKLHCPNALYLDGSLSGIYAPEIERTVAGVEYVGILAVTTDLPSADGTEAPAHE